MASPQGTKVFIGMPVRNGMPYFETALRELLDQTFQDLKIFISDNASTDGTRDIILQYAAQDSRVTYQFLDTGVSAGENFVNALSRVDSPYFMLAAHDDQHSRNFIEVLLERLEAEKSLIGAFCVGSTQRYGEASSPMRCPCMNSSQTTFENLAEYIGTPYPSMVYGVFRSTALADFIEIFKNYFDWGDVCLIYRLARKGKCEIVAKEMFTAGIPPGKQQSQSFRKKRSFFNLYYSYSGILIQGCKAILHLPVSFLEKIKLNMRHIMFVAGVFLGQDGDKSIILRTIVLFLCRFMNKLFWVYHKCNLTK